MALPVVIPNTFATATASIPLSQLDGNFNTLANAINGISDGSETLANVSATLLTAGTVDINGGAIDGTTIGNASPTTATFTDVTLNAQGDLRFADSDSSNWVAFQAPATVASNVTWTLPSADGTSGQVLSTDGSGTLSWASGGGGSLTGTTDSASPFETSLGSGAGAVNTGVNNTFVGFEAGNDNTTGTNNVAVGYQALDANTTGVNHVAIGFNTLGANTTGIENVAVGGYSLDANTTGSKNTALGTSALGSNTTASNNTAIGYDALAFNTTGTNNVAVGAFSLDANTTGARNNALGTYALTNATTANDNTAMGYDALGTTTTGSANTAFGSYALTANTTGTQNTAVGYQALDACTTGPKNTAVGYGAFTSLTTADESIAIGYNAGLVKSTGGGCVYIGGSATASSSSVAGEIVLATPNQTGKGGNTGFINPNGGGVYQGNNSSSWSTTSDQRLKKNIVDNTDGLNKLNAIRVRNFEYRLPEEVTDLPEHCAIEKTGIQLGVIAQELQQVCPDCVKEESTGVLSVDSDNVFWHMVNAIKELSAKCDSLQAEINTLKGQ